MTSQLTVTTSQFLQSIGVNVKMDFFDTSYADAPEVLAELTYIGVDTVRDLLPASDATSQAPYTLLTNSGITFDLVVPGGTEDLSATMAELDTFAALHPGAIAAIEGSNEVNIWPVTFNGQTGMAGAAAWQQALYGAVEADPNLTGIPVYSLTLGGGTPDQYAALGDLGAYATDGNAHVYPGDGDAPASLLSGLDSYVSYSGTDTPGDPTVLTEFGYYTMPDNPAFDGVNQDVQAKYTLDGLLDAFQAGVPMTYLYELMDGNADPGETNPQEHYGLFNSDGTAKEAATALHDLTTILADPSPGAAFAAGSLDVSVSAGNSLLMEKSTGAFDVVVWTEPAIWDQTTHSEVAAPVINSLVDFGQTFGTVRLFDPLVGTDPIATYSDVSSVTLGLTDHPLILELSVLCYHAGTRLVTDAGEVAVERIRDGDLVAVCGGTGTRFAPVRWIGHRRIDATRHPRPETVCPIRIRKNAIAPGLPRRDLLLSPDHGVFLDGGLIPARQLLNGMTIVQDSGVSALDYYHVELDRHALLLAEGLPTESYLDTGNRSIFENAGLALVLHPEFRVADRAQRWDAHACAPLMTAPAQVEPVWGRLAARAQTLGFTLPTPLAMTADPELRLLVGDRMLRPVSVANEHYVFALPRGHRTAALCSRSASPASIAPWHEDRRQLGVAVRRIRVHARRAIIDTPMDQPCLRTGWWRPEHQNEVLWRWTDGRAALPLPEDAAMLEIELHATHRYPAPAMGQVLAA